MSYVLSGLLSDEPTGSPRPANLKDDMANMSARLFFCKPNTSSYKLIYMVMIFSKPKIKTLYKYQMEYHYKNEEALKSLLRKDM